MGDHLVAHPAGEFGVRQVEFVAQALFERGRVEIGRDPVVFGLREILPEREEMLELRLDLAGELLLPEVVDEDLHPLLVDVVAPGVAVPHPQHRLQVGQDLSGRQEVADLVGDERRAPHAAAGVDLEADLAARILHDAQREIVPAQRRAILLGGDHADLELARQIAEFRHERGHLPDHLAPRARVDQLVGGSAGVLVGGDVADAFAAGLDRVHLDLGEIGQDVGRLVQLDPVVLDVLPGGEMAVAAVVLAGDVRQRVHLPRIERAVRDRHPQHVGVELKVEPVLEPQRLELVVVHLAGDPAAYLVAEFLDAGVDHRLVVLVVLVHQITQSLASGSAGFSVRSGRTVGPSARTRSLICAGRTLPSASRSPSIA